MGRMADLCDVIINQTPPVTGAMLFWNGSYWVNTTPDALANGDVLTWHHGAWVNMAGGSSIAGASVDITGITDGQTLVWDAETQSFVAGSGGAGISVDGIQDGQTVVWDADSGQFVAADTIDTNPTNDSAGSEYVITSGTIDIGGSYTDLPTGFGVKMTTPPATVASCYEAYIESVKARATLCTYNAGSVGAVTGLANDAIGSYGGEFGLTTTGLTPDTGVYAYLGFRDSGGNRYAGYFSGPVLINGDATLTGSATGWPDMVFEDGYDLMHLSELSDFVDLNKHLPHIPPEDEIAKSGLNLTEIVKGIVRTLEEQALYLINLDGRIPA